MALSFSFDNVSKSSLHMHNVRMLQNIASRLDYCNALLYGVSDRLMCRLLTA